MWELIFCLIYCVQVPENTLTQCGLANHTVLYYSFTVYNIATLTTWTSIYYVTTARLKFLFIACYNSTPTVSFTMAKLSRSTDDVNSSCTIYCSCSQCVIILC